MVTQNFPRRVRTANNTLCVSSQRREEIKDKRRDTSKTESSADPSWGLDEVCRTIDVVDTMTHYSHGIISYYALNL